MTASPIRRMGTSVGITGGSLAEVLNTRQKARRLKIMVTGGKGGLQKYGYPDQGGDRDASECAGVPGAAARPIRGGGARRAGAAAG